MIVKLKRFADSRWSTHLLLSIIFFCTFVLSFFFVKSEDDFTYLEKFNVLDSIFISLRFGNGRYLGNFLCRFFINRELADKLVRTLCYCSIILLSSLFTVGYKKRALIVSALLFGGIGKNIFSQVFVWGSGFYNYTPPIALMLLGIYLLKRYYFSEIVGKRFLCISLFAIGFCQQLFIENCTTINVLISLAIVCVVSRNKNNSKKPAVVYCSASFLGAGVMFFLPSILGVSYKMKPYRDIIGFSEYLSNGIENAVRILNDLSEQTMLWIFVSVSCMLLMKLNSDTFRKSGIIVKIYLCLFPALSFVQSINHNVTIFLIVDALFVVYCVCLFCVILRLLGKKNRQLIFSVVALAVISLLQLLIIKPCRARCIFLPYVILSLLVIWGLERLIVNMDKVKRYITFIGSLCLVFIYGILLFIYVNIWNVNNAKLDYIDKQMDEQKTTITLIRLPFEDWVHCGNESYVYPIRFNYGNPDEMSFAFIDYDEYISSVDIENK